MCNEYRRDHLMRTLGDRFKNMRMAGLAAMTLWWTAVAQVRMHAGAVTLRLLL